MFGLVKWGFWICVALMFVPVKTSDDNMKTSVLAQEVLQFGVVAFSDLSGFCDRNPHACHSGGETMSAIAERVKLGATQIYHYALWMGDKSYAMPEVEANRTIDIQHRKVTPVPISPSQNTLLPDDLKPAWRGTEQLAQAG